MKTFLSLIVLNSTIGTCHGLTAGNGGEPAARNHEVVATMEEMIASLRSEFNSTLEQKLTQQQQEFEVKLLQQNASFEQKLLQQRQEFEQRLSEQRDELGTLAHENRARIDTLENIVTQVIQASAPGRDQPIASSSKILLDVNKSGPAGDELISMLSRQVIFYDEYTPASKLYVLFYAMFYHQDPQVALALLRKLDSRSMNAAIQKNAEDVRGFWEELMDRLSDFSEFDEKASLCNVDVWRAFLEKIHPIILRTSGTYGLTALHVFVRNGPASIVQLLLDYMRPEDIFLPNHADDTAFHEAARASVAVAEVFASHPKTKAERFLDRSSTHESSHGPRGSTPLMLALEFHKKNYFSTAKVLLKWQIRKNVPPPFVKLRATCKLLRHALSLNANDTPSENDLCGALVSFEGKPELLRKIGNFLWRDQNFRSLSRSLANTKNTNNESVFEVIYRKLADPRMFCLQEKMLWLKSMLKNPARHY